MSRPVTAHGAGTNPIPPNDQIRRISDEMTINFCPPNINDLPLWQATREAELRALPLAAKRIARTHGVDATTARLLASLAGFDAGGCA